MALKGFKQGYYTPKHPEKYLGNVAKIRYMSSWELSFNHFLDNNPNVLNWASEEIAIPYIKPTSTRANKIHKYYPDYYIKYKTKNGKICEEIIEIKPANQVKQPTRKGKKKTTQVYEQLTWYTNQAKWASCQQFCDKYGIRFRIITEQELFK